MIVFRNIQTQKIPLQGGVFLCIYWCDGVDKIVA